MMLSSEDEVYLGRVCFAFCCAKESSTVPTAGPAIQDSKPKSLHETVKPGMIRLRNRRTGPEYSRPNVGGHRPTLRVEVSP